MATWLSSNSLVRGLLAAILAFAPVSASAAEPVTPAEAGASSQGKPIALDVALRPEGMLIGQLVAASGQPAAGAKVQLTLADGREAVAKTNAEGGFAFKGVRGVARLQSNKSLVVVRGWAHGSAPPNASAGVLLVEGQELARGQRPAGPVAQQAVGRSKSLLANPLFVAGVVGAAVAIPVAIHNSDDDDPAS